LGLFLGKKKQTKQLKIIQCPISFWPSYTPPYHSHIFSFVFSLETPPMFQAFKHSPDFFLVFWFFYSFPKKIPFFFFFFFFFILQVVVTIKEEKKGKLLFFSFLML
jgi:hypothetical protein